jgi:hypothetical protein
MPRGPLASKGLTDEAVRDIRSRRAAGEKCKTIARDHSISPSYVSDLAAGNRRKKAGGPLRAPKIEEQT